jgi:hypothetical protein
VRRAWIHAKKWQLYVVAIGTGLLIGGAEAGISFVGFIQSGVIFATIQRAFLYAKHAFSSSPKQNLYAFPMAAYFFASLIFPVVNSLSSYVPWINVLGIGSLILVVLKSNRETLEQETQHTSRHTLTPLTMLKNRLLTFLFLAVVMAAAFAPLPYNSGTTQDQISHLVWSGLHWMNPEPEPFAPEQAHVSRSASSTSLRDLLPPGGETAAWARISSDILSLLFILTIFAGVIWLTVWLIRHRNQLWERFRAWVNHYLGRDTLATAGYTDEQKKILDWKEWSRERLAQVAGWSPRLAREPFWGELADNTERVRRAYSRWVGRLLHAPKPSETPREIGEGEAEKRQLTAEEQKLLSLYESARYGGRKLTDQETEGLRSIYERK